MIHIFRDNYSYIDYITKDEIKSGEVICSNFIPSAFFTKDIIDYFFNKKEYIPQHKKASDKLWIYGRDVLKSIKANKLQIGIEFHSLKLFIEKGVVHEATENFEASLATRISAIDTLLNHIENIFILSEPTPYVFRLIPSDIIVFDVDRNKTQQTIQGMKIQDIIAYNEFRNEFERLKKTSINREKIIKSLTDCKTTLKAGVITKLKP